MGASVAIIPIIFFLAVFIVPPLVAYLTTRSNTGVAGVRLEEATLDKFKNLFAEPTEKYLSSIGNGYIINFLAGNSFASGFSVISNKRVYFKGKCYYKENSKLKKSIEERTVDLKDVTGTGYISVNPIYLLVAACISLFVFIVMLILAFTFRDVDGVWNVILGVLSFASFIGFPLSSTLYILKHKTLFEIAFAGGKIAFDTYLYSKSEIDEFQKQLRRAKDSIVEAAPQIVATPSVQSPIMTNSKLGIADELKKYADLLEQKLITQQEFDDVKKKLLSTDM